MMIQNNNSNSSECIVEIIKSIYANYPQNNELINARVKLETEHFQNDLELINYFQSLDIEDRKKLSCMQFCESLLLSDLFGYVLNPLPAHYICGNCKFLEFSKEPVYRLSDKICPDCGILLNKNGTDIPFIEKNFSGHYSIRSNKKLTEEELKFNTLNEELKRPECFEKKNPKVNWFSRLNFFYKKNSLFDNLKEDLNIPTDIFNFNYRIDAFRDLNSQKKKNSNLLKYIIVNDYISFEDYLKITCLQRGTINNELLNFSDIQFFSREGVYRYLKTKIYDKQILSKTYNNIKFGRIERISSDILNIFEKNFIMKIKEFVYLWSESYFYAHNINRKKFNK